MGPDACLVAPGDGRLGPATAADEPGFVSLFNGKDLSGWEGLSPHWSVEDGAITGRTTAETALKGHNTFLVWQGGSPADFELRAKFKLQGGNSGIQYRSKLLDPAKFIVGGYQADIDTTGRYIGINYEEKGRGILTERGQKVEIGRTARRSSRSSATRTSSSRRSTWPAGTNTRSSPRAIISRT